MQTIVDSLTSIAKKKIQRDIECTKDCACGVGLDPDTMAVLRQLTAFKLLSVVDRTYDYFTASVHPAPTLKGKGVTKMIEFERCVLIALGGFAIQVISSRFIARNSAREVIEEAFKDRSCERW